MSKKAASIFGDNDDIPALKPRSTLVEDVEAPNSSGVASVFEEEGPEDRLAVGMRQLARETGYAGKTVFDYSAEDHRNAPRKTKTFTGNPETALECMNAFCKKMRWSDKDALYEALKLLGEKYDFDPLANLPTWQYMRRK